METIRIFPGHDKTGAPERFAPLTMRRGELYTIVGDTGSGKSRLIKDIEQLACGDSATGRVVQLDGESLRGRRRLDCSGALVAHLSQNMRFVLDTTVERFVTMHAQCRGRAVRPQEVTALANLLTPEPIRAGQSLNLLSGGQARALMVADVALVCDAPVVLVDEIENAGLDKEEALRQLQSREKLVLVATHDVHTALMAPRRLVMRGGAVIAVAERTPQEETLRRTLGEQYRRERELQRRLRAGEALA